MMERYPEPYDDRYGRYGDEYIQDTSYDQYYEEPEGRKPKKSRLRTVARACGAGILAVCAYVYAQDNYPGEVHDAREIIANTVGTSQPCEVEGFTGVRNSLADMISDVDICAPPPRN